MGEATWVQYREEAFGDPYLVWHDGPDFRAFREKWAADPELASHLLVEGIAEGDALAAQTVAELDLTPDQRLHFTGILLAATVLQQGAARIAAARALFHITGDASHGAVIAEELNASLFWSDQMGAALALRDFPATVDLVAALTRTISENEEYLVRYHACNTLLAWSGSDAGIENDEELFSLIVADDPEGWKRAVIDLSARIPFPAGGAA